MPVGLAWPVLPKAVPSALSSRQRAQTISWGHSWLDPSVGMRPLDALSPESELRDTDNKLEAESQSWLNQRKGYRCQGPLSRSSSHHSWGLECCSSFYINKITEVKYLSMVSVVNSGNGLLFFVSLICKYLIITCQTRWRRQWHPTPVLLPGKSQGQRSLVDCSPWGCEESDTTEWLHFHFSLSCIGEGDGSPLQYSCLENPRDGRAWWAAVYGVA